MSGRGDRAALAALASFPTGVGAVVGVLREPDLWRLGARGLAERAPADAIGERWRVSAAGSAYLGIGGVRER